MEKIRKLFAIILAVAVMLCFSVTLFADLGPKPSIHIEFINLPDGQWYGTLLSKNDTTGPSSAWNGEEKYAQHNENPEYSWADFDYKTWKAFVDYRDPDGFYFLQEGWDIVESKDIHWTYYPPNEFKILLYNADTGEFISSMIYERYAFDSYFTVDMQTVASVVPDSAVIYDHVNPNTGDYGEDVSAEKVVLAHRSYDYTREIASLLIRIVLTVIIELVVAVAFVIIGKKPFAVLLITNVITQILLNLFIGIADYAMGYMAFVALYILLEILVFAIEACVYARLLPKHSPKPKKAWYYVLYAFVANGTSFGLGLWLASISASVL